MKKYNAYHFVIILGIIAGIISLVRSLNDPGFQTIISCGVIIIFALILYKYNPKS
jgi:FtsH-binding integral membrane protein